VDRVGNTAAAGHRVALAAFGGGTTWGAATLTWPEMPGRPPAPPPPDQGSPAPFALNADPHRRAPAPHDRRLWRYCAESGV